MKLKAKSENRTVLKQVAQLAARFYLTCCIHPSHDCPPSFKRTTASLQAMFFGSLSGILGIGVDPNDCDWEWQVGVACGQLLLAMWTQPDRLGTKYWEDVHLFLSAGLHPGASAQRHGALGAMQTHQVQPVAPEPVHNSPVSMAHTTACLSPGRTPKRRSSWSIWRWQIWSTSSLCP